jgi:hypothetical protein
MENSPPPAAQALTIEALLELHDEAFVVKAYVAILGRTPDPGGLKNYLTQVRAGDDKVQILAELAQSPEGRMKSTEIRGLSKAIAEYRKRAPSFWSRLYRRLAGTAMEPTDRHLRVIDNQLHRLEQRLAQQTEQLGDLRTLVLQMLSNSGSSDPVSFTSNNEDAAHIPRSSHISTNLARTFSELKTAIEMKRVK